MGLLITATVLLIGFVLALAFSWRRGAILGRMLLPSLALSPALGFGWTSLLFFFFRFLGFGAPGWFAVASATGLLVALALLVNRKRPPVESGATQREVPVFAPAPAWSRLTILMLVVTGACACLLFHLWNRQRPDGDWDAIAIWNSRARLLNRSEGDLSAVIPRFSRASHLDYPLLVPGAIAAQFRLLGRESRLIPQATAFAFMLGTALLAFVTVRRLGAPSLAAAAVLLLFSTPYFVDRSQAQMADVPLGYLFLAAMGGLASQLRSRTAEHTPAIVCGICLGLLFWTKNEGVLLAGILLGVFLPIHLLRPSAGNRVWALGMVLLGALPSVVAFALFKKYWATKEPFVGLGLGALRWSLLNLARWQITATGYQAELGLWSRWGLIWPFMLIAMVLWLRARTAMRPAPMAFMTVCLMVSLLTGVLIYVATPLDQKWHIRSSVGRLLLQLLPALIVWVCCLYRASLPPPPRDRRIQDLDRQLFEKG